MQESTPSEILEEANQQHLLGNQDKTRELYLQVLAVDPANARASFGIGLLELQLGQYESALQHMQTAIALEPKEKRYFFGLGQVLAEMKRFDEAEDAYRQALSGNPNVADIHFAIGRLQEMQGRWAEARSAYEKALQLQPAMVDAIINLGNCHQQTGEFCQAEEIYRRILARHPNHAGARSNLGLVLAKQGRVEDGIAELHQAIALEPAQLSHYLNFGALLCEQRDFAEANKVLRRAVEIAPECAEAAYNLANALHGFGDLPGAVGEYQRAVQLKPDYAEACNNLGALYKEMGDLAAAKVAFAHALRFGPDAIATLNNAANLHRALGELDEAENLLRQALQINPHFSATYNNLGNVLKDAGALDEGIACYRRAINLNPANADAHSNLVYSIYFQLDDPQEIVLECRKWDEQHGRALGDRPQAKSASRHRRLRIGYVSGDFREHCQSLFTIPLLSHHNHEKVEVFCYSCVTRSDQYTRQIASYSDAWRDVAHLHDVDLAALIEKDEIDILVDLAMHMAGGRSGLFACKPAPVQAAWLAYPGTTGLSAMDYILLDPWLAPIGTETDYCEKVLRLPDTFWCYDPLEKNIPVNELPALANGYVTFGCLNAPYKITDHTLRLWANVMTKIPQSRLLLMARPTRHRQRILDRFEALGVAANRVAFQSFLPRSAYLRSYHQIDLGLDTIPYNGHTTSLDSYWMGVPVVSRVGTTSVGRAGLSQLSNLRLGELIAKTDEQFVEIAVRLVSDLPRLTQMRGDLRQRMENSPLMDAQRFARGMEGAFEEMWSQRHL